MNFMKLVTGSRINLAAVILTSLSIHGCGSRREAHLNVQSASESAQLLLFGGNRSCKSSTDSIPSPVTMDMAPRAIGLINRFRSDGGTAEVLTSCFIDPDKILLSRNFSPKFDTVDPDTLIDQAMAGIDANQRIFIIGHSYGGWIAMKIAERFTSKSGQVAGLITIDAISRKGCTYSNWSNCLAAPQDFSKESLDEVKTNTRHWANFYQTTTPYLHSGSIAQADVNLELQASHFTIDTNEAVWRHADRMLNGIEP
ncbi:MAG: hypothetical protein EBU49_02940 [Proteobacteria bacterium]|nr:hypothetical protein [Pseudomonadota bacterium]